MPLKIPGVWGQSPQGSALRGSRRSLALSCSSCSSSTRGSGSFRHSSRRCWQRCVKPVQQRRRHPLPLEHLAPLAERQVARHQQAPPLVAVGEHLEQQLRPRPAERQVAQLVADQQVRPVQLAQHPVQLVLLLRLLQPRHQRRRREEAHPLALPARRQPQARSPGASCPSPDCRSGRRWSSARSTRRAPVPAPWACSACGTAVKSKVSKSLCTGKSACADACLHGVAGAGRHLQFGQPQQVLLVALVGGGRLAGQLLELGCHRRQPQLLEVAAQQQHVCHRPSAASPCVSSWSNRPRSGRGTWISSIGGPQGRRHARRPARPTAAPSPRSVRRGLPRGSVQASTACCTRCQRVLGQQLQHADVLPRPGRRAVPLLQRLPQLRERLGQLPVAQHRGVVQRRRPAAQRRQVVQRVEDLLVAAVTAACRATTWPPSTTSTRST